MKDLEVGIKVAGSSQSDTTPCVDHIQQREESVCSMIYLILDTSI